MKRTKLSDRQLPDYSRGEEIMNMVTHIVGGAVGVVALTLCVIFAALHANPWGVVTSAIYGSAMVTMFTISSVYHGLKPTLGKKVMQVIDHCTIYLLIAGTYTPILLAAIRPAYPALAWGIFAAEWGITAVAVVFTAIDHNRFAALSMVCYIAMGWCIVLALKPTLAVLGRVGFWWLLAGGISYTLGAALYGVGSKKPIFHTVFHVFVDLGSALQAVCILKYVL